MKQDMSIEKGSHLAQLGRCQDAQHSELGGEAQPSPRLLYQRFFIG